MTAFSVKPLAGNLVVFLTVAAISPGLQVLAWMLSDARERKDYFGRWPLRIAGPVWVLGVIANCVGGWFFGVFLGKRVAQLTVFGALKAAIAVLSVVLIVAVAGALVIVYVVLSRPTQGVIPLVDVGALAGTAVIEAVASPDAAPLMDRKALPEEAEHRRPTLLDVESLEVFYGAARALRGVSFRVHPGEVVSIIGGNGAGKSTTLKTVSGVPELLKTVVGAISFAGERIERLPSHEIARMGIVHVPEGRRVFPESSVEDNLVLGAYRRYRSGRSTLSDDLEAVYERFPILRDRRHRAAGYLSGGEQQMLAIGRGLMARPTLLLLDEPSLGLAPILIQQMFEIIRQLAAEGTTILLVEQMANQALEIADRAYVLETGSITLTGTGLELLENPAVKEAYLGA